MSNFIKKVAFAAVIVLFAIVAEGQNPPQPAATIIRGSILDATDLQPIQYVNVYVRHGYGTVSNENGYFELPCHLDDTINFSYVGYQRVIFPVPDSLIGRSRVIGIVMRTDTVLLGEVVVLPFIPYAQLKYEVANIQPDENISLAISNVDVAVKSALCDPHPILDAELGPMNQLTKYTERLEYGGMFAPSQMLTVIGTNSGAIRYFRQIGKRNVRPATSNHQKQLQMAKDVRKFVLDKKESSKDGDE